ncbi:MAG: AAA family ATPase [Candidatus Enterosoma sp.]|nr:AAA family ATPase [Bacilli bacterium]MDY3047662.1 AAA family ATPase [Candidatus Enterosoma sp.]
MILKRKIYQKLLDWKKTSNGSTALMIDGARRVGKSFVAEEFAKNEYKSYIIVDFSNISPALENLFTNERYDLDFFFQKLSVYYSTVLYKRESLIIFDEIQQFPLARQFIKHLVKDGRYDYLETSSLIRLKKNTLNIVIPSEEEHIEMFPLDFEEFLWAIEDTVTVPMLKECFEKKKPLGEAIHRKTMNSFKQYMLVGGMPQAVLAYLPDKSFERADKAKRNIINLYREDVTKFAEGYEDKVFAVFDNIPAQLSRKEKKYKITSLQPSARFRNYEDAFVWLHEAMIVNQCFNCTDPNIGLALSADHATQKCYMADTGLLVTLAFMDVPFVQNELYKAILFDNLNINEGMLMENIVAQTLRFNGHKLYFYSRSDTEHRENHMEIDFLISEGKKISPIEVKSSKYQTHSSLDKFIAKFKGRYSQPYILYTKDLNMKDGILHLPLYMTMFL